jgi:hypothetical protein
MHDSTLHNRYASHLSSNGAEQLGLWRNNLTHVYPTLSGSHALYRVVNDAAKSQDYTCAIPGTDATAATFYAGCMALRIGE